MGALRRIWIGDDLVQPVERLAPICWGFGVGIAAIGQLQPEFPQLGSSIGVLRADDVEREKGRERLLYEVRLAHAPPSVHAHKLGLVRRLASFEQFTLDPSTDQIHVEPLCLILFDFGFSIAIILRNSRYLN